MAIKAKLTTFDATMIVVSLIIGIGIFRTPAMDRRRGQDADALLRRLGPRRPGQLHRRPDLRRDRRPLRQARQLLQGRRRNYGSGLAFMLNRPTSSSLTGLGLPEVALIGGGIPDAHRLSRCGPLDRDRPDHGRRPHPRPPGHQLPRHQDGRLGPERPERSQGRHDRRPCRGRIPVQEGPRRSAALPRQALVLRPRRRLHLRLLRLRRLQNTINFGADVHDARRNVPGRSSSASSSSWPAT